MGLNLELIWEFQELLVESFANGPAAAKGKLIAKSNVLQAEAYYVANRVSPMCQRPSHCFLGACDNYMSTANQFKIPFADKTDLLKHY